jgi:hypothetical protein
VLLTENTKRNFILKIVEGIFLCFIFNKKHRDGLKISVKMTMLEKREQEREREERKRQTETERTKRQTARKRAKSAKVFLASFQDTLGNRYLIYLLLE